MQRTKKYKGQITTFFTLNFSTIASLLFIVLPISRGGVILNIDTGFFKLSLTALIFLGIINRTPVNQRNFSIDLHRIYLLIILLCVLTTLSFLNSDVKPLSFRYTVFFYTSVCTFFIFCKLIDQKFIKKALLMLSLSTFAACGIAFLQYLVIHFRFTNLWLLILIPHEFKQQILHSGEHIYSNAIRLPSFFYHSNGFGHFLAMVFAIHLPLFIVAQQKKEQLFYLTALLAIFASCLLTLSRGSALVILIEGIIICLLLRNELMKRAKWIFFFGICMIVISAFFLSLNFHNFTERILTAGLANRDINWEYAVKLIPKISFWGVGPGMCSYHMLSGHPFTTEYFGHIINELQTSGQLNWYISHAHNFYLNTLIETGPLSLVVYILLLGSILKKGTRILREQQNPAIRALTVGSFVALIGSIVRGLFESYVFWGSSYVGYLVSFYLTLILYLDAYTKKNVEADLLKR